MRTLAKNQTTMYLVGVQSYADATDGDGNLTGEKVVTYESPVEIKLSLYPSKGDISREEFGRTEQFDYMAISMDVELKENDLLFYELPTSDYDSTYDFKVSKNMKSLNSYNYGLESRVWT